MADWVKLAATPAWIEVARAKLVEAGFNLAGDTGVLQKDAYRIGYAVADGVLFLELLTQPRFVPMIAVKVKIRSVLSGEGVSELG